MTTLRRVDWRFLLPARVEGRYRRLVVLGGSTALPAQLTEVAEEVTTDRRSLTGADAVVVTAESTEAMADVIGQVAGSAVLYIEVDRRRHGRRGLTPARLRRMLQDAGFTVQASYWVLPEFQRARRHIPLDARAPLEWYLRNLQTAGSPWAVAAETGIRLLARAGPRWLAAWVPCYSVTAVGPTCPADTAGVFGAVPTAVAMLTSGQDDGSRVVLLPFERHDRAPARVVKLARLPSFESHTEQEQRTLAELRGRLPLALRSSVPEPLGVRRWNGMLVATESYAPGAPLVVSSGRFGAPFAVAREDLRQTVSWLIAFHQATQSPDGAWSDALVARSLDRLSACRSLVDAQSPARALLDAAESASMRLIGVRIPIVPLHNDLGPWNVHRHGPDVTVIDWELGDHRAGERKGPGVCDLIYFLTFWSFRARHLRTPRGELRGIRELFVTPDGGVPATRAAREELERYTTAVSLDPRFLPLLLVLTWVNRAVERLGRARMIDDDRAAGAGYPYVRYLEVLAESGGPWSARRRWP